MTLKELIGKVLHKEDRLKDMEKDYRLHKKLEAKQMNSNERELNRFLEEERQKRIKQRLDSFRRKRMDEAWHGKQILGEKNIFKDHQSIMTGKSTFNMKMPKEKNIFTK